MKFLRFRSPPPPPLPPLPELAGLIDEMGPRLMAEHGVPGAQVAVCVRGRVVLGRAWGVANAANGTLLQNDHVFKACSNGKPLASMVALRLVKEGRLELDAPIWSFTGGWRLPEDRRGGFDADGVTLRRLLSHQSGFSLRGFPQVEWAEAAPPSTLAILDGYFGGELTPRLTSEPGTTVVYGGDATTLAQLAMEAVTGRAFPELFDRLIARPLRLRATWFGRRVEMSDRLVACHGEAGDPEPGRFYPALAASGLYTTAAELAMVYAKVPRVVGSADAATMITPQTPPKDEWRFGIGFAVAESNGRCVYKHAGWNESAWGAAEGVGPRVSADNPGRREWPLAAGAVLCNSSRGKEVCLPLLGAITQWLTSKLL